MHLDYSYFRRKGRSVLPFADGFMFLSLLGYIAFAYIVFFRDYLFFKHASFLVIVWFIFCVLFAIDKNLNKEISGLKFFLYIVLMALGMSFPYYFLVLRKQIKRLNGI
jgi:hypothetical protein